MQVKAIYQTGNLAEESFASFLLSHCAWGRGVLGAGWRVFMLPASCLEESEGKMLFSFRYSHTGICKGLEWVGRMCLQEVQVERNPVPAAR